MPPRKLKVGAAQFASAIGDVDANLPRHLDWIAQGRSAGLDLLVMPEASLTGHHGPRTCCARPCAATTRGWRGSPRRRATWPP